MEGNSSGSIGGIVGRHHPHPEPRDGSVNIKVNVEGDLNVNLSRENNFHHLQGRPGLGAHFDGGARGLEEGRNSLLFEAGVGEGMRDAFKAIQKERLQARLIDGKDGDGDEQAGARAAGSIASGIGDGGSFIGISKGDGKGGNPSDKNEKDLGYIDCEWDRALGNSAISKHGADIRKEK